MKIRDEDISFLLQTSFNIITGHGMGIFDDKLSLHLGGKKNIICTSKEFLFLLLIIRKFWSN
jgi:hypothetical protein